MRQFITSSLKFILPMFVILGSISAYVYTMVKPNQMGDLAQLGNFSVLGARNYTCELKERWVPSKYAPRLYGSQQNAAVVSIGDSFLGLAPSFIDYCASATEVDIYSLSTTGDDLFNIAMAMLNRGCFERFGTKTLVLESIERSFYNRVEQVDLKGTVLSDRFEEQLGVNHEAPELGFANSVYYMPQKSKFSFAEVCNWLLLLMKGSAVGKVPLEKPMFSLEESTLYFYKNDLLYSCLNEDQLKLMKVKLNKMYDKFKSHGIELIVVCIPDKYYAYQDYIIDNPYPRSCTGEQISKLDLHGEFIYAGELVNRLISQGERDIYFIDDAHWSPKAGKIFGEEFARIIDSTH